MIDVEWNDNAKAAVEYFADWAKLADNGLLDVFMQGISANTQTKTVADAVEHFDGVWPATIAGDPPPKDKQVIIYCTESTPCGSKVGNYYAGGRGFDSSYFYLVCTRAEFEAYVKEQESEPHFKATRENLEKIAKDCQGVFVEVEQEGEKWTHIDREGDKCKVLHIHDEMAWITYYGGFEDDIIPIEQLKPIKPTISESELLRKIKDMGKGVASDGHFGDTVRGWLDEYDII